MSTRRIPKFGQRVIAAVRPLLPDGVTIVDVVGRGDPVFCLQMGNASGRVMLYGNARDWTYLESPRRLILDAADKADRQARDPRYTDESRRADAVLAELLTEAGR